MMKIANRKLRPDVRERIVAAWARLAIRGERVSNRRLAKEAGVGEKTAEEYKRMLMPYFGGDEQDDDCEMSDFEIKVRTALVRAAKSRIGGEGLDAETLQWVLPD